MRRIGIKTTARAVGLLAIVAAIVATDVHLRHSSVCPTDHFNARAAAPSDRLERELLRCQAIGIKAKDDAACEAAWAENRRRFFAPLAERPSALAPDTDGGPPR
jgi:conjugative transfer region protein TrbK